MDDEATPEDWEEIVGKRASSRDSCKLCGETTVHAATKRCDRCWELEKRIKADPALTRKILALVEVKERAAGLS